MLLDIKKEALADNREYFTECFKLVLEEAQRDNDEEIIELCQTKLDEIKGFDTDSVSVSVNDYKSHSEEIVYCKMMAHGYKKIGVSTPEHITTRLRHLNLFK